MKWTDIQDIAIALVDAHPDQDPAKVRFTDLYQWVMALPGFDKSVRLGPFFDAGNVFSDNYTIGKEGLAMSVGLTAAWISPLGPLKFSYGQPINEKSNAKLQKFQFQMGTTF